MPTKAEGPTPSKRMHFSNLHVEYVSDLDAFRITFTASAWDDYDIPDSPPMTLWMSPDEMREASVDFRDAWNVRTRTFGEDDDSED